MKTEIQDETLRLFDVFTDIKPVKSLVFTDVKYMTAKEKEKVYKQFKDVINNRSLTYMHDQLYKHLNLHCGYIAHYDIHGFKAEYSSPKDFLRFLDNFIKPQRNIFYGHEGEYRDISGAMVEYVNAHYEAIRQEMLHADYLSDLDIIRLLAKKHNLEITINRQAL